MRPTITLHTLPAFTIDGPDRAYIMDVCARDGEWNSYVVQSGVRHTITLLGTIEGESIILSVRRLAVPSIWKRLVAIYRGKRVMA